MATGHCSTQGGVLCLGPLMFPLGSVPREHSGCRNLFCFEVAWKESFCQRAIRQRLLHDASRRWVMCFLSPCGFVCVFILNRRGTLEINT